MRRAGFGQSIQDAQRRTNALPLLQERDKTYAQTTLLLLLSVTAPAAEPQDSFLLSEA
jgi:hypothetical protein